MLSRAPSHVPSRMPTVCVPCACTACLLPDVRSTRRADLEDEEYAEMKQDTLEQLKEFQESLTNMAEGNMSLVDEIGAMQLVGRCGCFRSSCWVDVAASTPLASPCKHYSLKGRLQLVCPCQPVPARPPVPARALMYLSLSTCVQHTHTCLPSLHPSSALQHLLGSSLRLLFRPSGRPSAKRSRRQRSFACLQSASLDSFGTALQVSNLPLVTLTPSWEAPRFLLPAMHEPQSAPQLHATCKYAAAGRCLLGIDSAATVFTPIRPPTLRHACHAFVPLLSCPCVQKWSVTSSLARFPRMSRLTRRWRSSRRYGSLATR